MKVITRFAPSPTGHLHIGGGRTAIFSWLLARHFDGEFRLRIEDTDTERSMQEFTDSILASMKWLGLDWDKDIVYQSQRQDVYNVYINKLLETGHAYYCNCSKEEVDAMREVARAKGEKPKYNGKCRTSTLDSGVVRLKVPESGRVVFQDMVKGNIAVDVDELDDMVLRRADGTPTYNMAVVIDDYEMGVTHVVRGDDHVSNTPKQILIYQALGLELPIFAHVPMILGADRQKLSKRHGARAVIEYEQEGLLPHALVNYLVRLGWAHGDQEIFSMEELIEFFDGTSLNSSPAAFDLDKVQWINGQYLRNTPVEKLVPLLIPFVEENGHTIELDFLTKITPLYTERTSNLKNLADQLTPLLVDVASMNIEEKALKALDDEAKKHLTQIAVKIEELNDFTEEGIEKLIYDYVESNELKFKQVGLPLRASLTGTAGGPSVHLILFALGKEESIKRLRFVR